MSPQAGGAMSRYGYASGVGPEARRRVYITPDPSRSPSVPATVTTSLHPNAGHVTSLMLTCRCSQSTLTDEPQRIRAVQDQEERPMGTRVRELAAALYQDEAGATLVEYILLAVLIGVAAI